jgi:sugar lactone lactonase YvrE
LVLLSLSDGETKGQADVGSDPVAVAVSSDGRTAYVADSAPGDVIAVKLPELTEVWKAHVGGAPFGLLPFRDRLYVSLFSGKAVVELDPATGTQLASHPVTDGPAALAVDAEGRVVVAGTRGEVDRLDGTSVPAGNGFGIAIIGDQIWSADYARAELVRTGDHLRVGMPDPTFPFWLAPGAGGTLLISAEGAREDSDPGGVYAFDPGSRQFTTLARPKDPDQIVQSGSTEFVAAHGDREVLAISGGHVADWATGAAAVGLAPDGRLGLLVVVTNSHE